MFFSGDESKSAKTRFEDSLRDIWDSLDSRDAVYRVPCKLKLDESSKQIDVFGLITKSPLLCTFKVLFEEQLLSDVELFTLARNSQKVCYDGSPLAVPDATFCIRKIKDSSYEYFLDFGIALSNSSYPNVRAADLTVQPLFGRILRRAFPSIPRERIDLLLPDNELRKAYQKGDTLTVPGPRVRPIQFYQAICGHKFPEPAKLLQHPSLHTQMLDYQQQTIQWCLLQEGKAVSKEKNALVDASPADIPFPPWGWSQVYERGRNIWVAPELGLVCKSEAQLRQESYRQLVEGGAKGLIAEEMGLGKSLETIALILLNRRPLSDTGQLVLDPYSGDYVLKAKTTLIITPDSIHEQWKEEFNRHCPGLSLYVYKGATQAAGHVTAESMAEFDVVLTTYRIIAKDLHHALKPPSRSMRNERKYERIVSPLVQIQFWRVLLDEVQLVESGVGNAAQVARTIPRFHAWGVSGTPVRTELSDLAGLLLFLRYIPFTQGSSSKVWQRLCRDVPEFCDFFHRISVRHTKDMVKDSIALPPQRRIVLKIPFTTVEENNYRHLFQQFLDDCGFNPEGGPARDDWDPAEELPKMSKWLVRLRQTCCHAQIGVGNRRALGGGPLRTVKDVLEAMYENAHSAVQTDERLLWTSKIQRGQLLEQAEKRDEALELLIEACDGVRKVLAQCRKSLAEESEKVRKSGDDQKSETGSLSPAPQSKKVNSDDYYEDEQKREERLEREEEEKLKSRVLSARLRVRTFLELEHRCLFFIGSIYFQMENKQLEDEYYALAQTARQELLLESQQKAQKLMDSLTKMAKKKKMVEIPDIRKIDPSNSPIEIRPVADAARALCGILNAQSDVLDEWREKVVSLLSQNLVDKDSEPDGEEYGESLDAQEEGFSYQEAIRQTLADRHEAVEGVRNSLVHYDVSREDALDQRTDLDKRLTDERKAVKPPPELRSLKHLVEDMRRHVTQLAYDAEDASGERRHRLEIEHSLADKELTKLRDIMNGQKKALDNLDKELLFFKSVYNARIEYYKQLQQISDGVAVFEPKEPEKFSKTASVQETKLVDKIDGGYARLRYLEHLRNSMLGNTGSVPESERTCVICQSPFEIGSLTVCGHQYCRECMLEWWRSHHTCPICKKVLKSRDVYSISYKPSEIEAHEEQTANPDPASSSPKAAARAIYADVSEEALNQIKAVDLVQSYGSKIDMILRHMIWLRETTPNVQVVLFSQFTDFLNLVATALSNHGIRYATVENNMDKFKSNPEYMCFLLHAKSQSSGLTLVNATQVIICEPLFNTALELQAISRVHRIGQTRPTTVWMYAISGTVEESVLDLTTKRRLALLGTKDGEQLTEASLDTSNSIQLSRTAGKMVNTKGGGGEIVPQDEIWGLFFGKSDIHEAHQEMELMDIALQSEHAERKPELQQVALEYRRGVMADSAEQRASGGS
ncbi:SNF2 family N-terminal domain-containing protein [Myxozyma melibiosi]|uniref:SNF2 family N-terminal domain-containing protein n=1 Tax=Myxozyma melibiosi TaxID=54550 RepID=A0ABR1F9N2_9ASCO